MRALRKTRGQKRAHVQRDLLQDIADPLIGLAIALVILRITWHSWQTIRAG